MKKAFKIAQTEWKTLFYSPIAWIVLIVFLIQNGLDYTDWIDRLRQSSATGTPFPGITAYLFNSYEGLFTVVQGRLYLYLPLLTMGLMSREISSGSIKLLLSSPITIGEIIAGKLMGIMGYCMVLLGVLVSLVLVTGLYFPHPDLGMMFSGLLAIFLTMLLYAAIGLFLSSLTGYPAIAALCTFALLAALNFSGEAGQSMSLIRKVGVLLSIRGRADQMLKGLIITRQVEYFMLTSLIFIGFTTIRLRQERRPQGFVLQAVKYLFLFLIVLGLGYVSGLPGGTGYLDLTAAKTQTVSEGSKAILRKLPPIRVHAYSNLLDENFPLGLEAPQEDIAFFDKYQRYLKSAIQFEYTYYYDSIPPDSYIYQKNHGVSLEDLAENVADDKGFPMKGVVDSNQIRKRIDLRPWHNKFVRQLSAGDGMSMIGLFADPFNPSPGESEMMDALKLLYTPKQHVAFLTGHNERTAEIGGTKDKDYNMRMTSPIKTSMMNHGFDFRNIRIDSGNIPEDISLLIIADPRLPLSQSSLTKISQYISEGRDLWICGEPDRKALLTPLIEPLGISFMDGMFLEDSNKYDMGSQYLIARVAPQARKLSGEMKGLFDDSSNLTTSGACGLVFDKNGPFDISPFIVTNPLTTWNHIGPFDTAAKWMHYDYTKGDRRGVFPVGLTLKRTIRHREQRILVMGDADMLSDGGFNFIPKKDAEISKEIFKWFSRGLFPVDIVHAPQLDTLTTITSGGITLLKWIYLFVLPGLLLLTGGLLLLIRQRR